MKEKQDDFLEWFNSMSAKVYQANKEKGFWDKERSGKECLALIISEMSEAMEADRNRKIFKLNETRGGSIALMKEHSESLNDKAFRVMFRAEVKDTFEDEIADTIIRILDFVGSEGIKVDELVEADFCIKDSFSESFFRFCDDIVYCGMFNDACFNILASNAFVLMDHYGFDRIKTHVELKLKYNSLRAYKHGKKY